MPPAAPAGEAGGTPARGRNQRSLQTRQRIPQQGPGCPPRGVGACPSVLDWTDREEIRRRPDEVGEAIRAHHMNATLNKLGCFKQAATRH